MSKNINILLVEDDLNLGSLLKDYLSLKNFNVTLCDDGMKGINEFVKNSFHLCILDIMLPKKDGFTLAEEIKNINQNIPIIFLTAKQMQEDKIKGLKIGADDYITKPFNSEELLLRINAILRRVETKDELNEIQNFNIGNYHFDYLNRSLEFKKDIKRLTSK
ncbi:MAG: response regulator transcription factor, partial [Ignavibacteriae bacterium]|nr:response regulator transcription factor [Ignavibacteriota bacterium]